MRRRTLLTLPAFLVPALAGCSATSEQPDATTSSIPSGYPMTVQTGMGDTVVLPSRPSRIVVLASGSPDQLLTLGVTPVALATTGGTTKVPAYLSEALADVERIGTASEVDLERLAAIAPDLIVTSSLAGADDYPLLAAIAPTVMTVAEVGRGWKDNFRQLGALLNESQRAEEVLADYERRAAALGASILAANGGTTPTVSLVRFDPDRIRLMQRASFAGTILDDVGLARPESQQSTEEVSVEISIEELRLADADHVFDGATVETDDGGASYRSTRLWRQLSAVQAGAVTEVADDVWYVGIGPRAADVVLQQLAEAFQVAPAG